MRHAGTDTTFTGKRVVVAVMLAGLAAFVLLGMRGEAQACGGLFCNAPPPDPFAPLPVAQNGENVVFSITNDPAGGAPTLQAHIQILYTGDAAKFSWVVPVDAAPELSTGTDRLFSVLANATQPVFQANTEVSGTCIPEPITGVTGTGNSGGGFATGAAGTTGSRRDQRRRRHGQFPGGGRTVRRGRHQVGRFRRAAHVADRQRLHRQRPGGGSDRRLRAREQALRRAQAAQRRRRAIDPADRADVQGRRGVRAAALDRDRRQPGHAGAGVGAGQGARRAARLLRDEDRRDAPRLGDRWRQLLRRVGARQPGRQRSGRQRVRDRIRGNVEHRGRGGLRARAVQRRGAARGDDAACVRGAGAGAGSGQRHADAAAAGEVHPDARHGEGDGHHRVAVLRQPQHVLEPVRVPALRPGGADHRDRDVDHQAARRCADDDRRASRI